MDGSAGAYWELRFEADGTVAPRSGEVAALVEQVRDSGTQDLFVMSHGWGNSEEVADQLYRGMFGLLQASPGVPASARFLAVYWPSLWFPDPPADGERDLPRSRETAPPPPGQADAAVSGKAIATSLADGFSGSDRDDIRRMGRLVDAGLKGVAAGESQEVQQARLEEFHALLGKVFATPSSPGDVEDSGETALFATDDPGTAYGKLSAVMGSAPSEGDVQGIGDFFGKVWNGAKDALRVGSYFQMKSRAGDVGRDGLGAFLVALHGAAPGVRVHLIGHSFGARLVAFSLAGFADPQQSPVASLTLVQGAFSHWSFSDGSSDLGIKGALAGFQNRVKGPLCATFTSADWAVGNWYPKASFLAQQDNQDSEGVSRWGGMGADGYRGVPARDLALPLTGQETFAPGEFHRIDANFVITDTSAGPFAGAHSDIQKPEVAALIVAAARAATG